MAELNAAGDALYLGGVATLLASWEEYARGSEGASVVRRRGVSVAVFPIGPERAVYNNAVFDRGLGTAERSDAIAAMTNAYAEAGVDRYAAWVHEGDGPMHRELRVRGHGVSEFTRAMGISLDDFDAPAAGVDLRRIAWADYLAFLGRDHEVPEGLLEGVEPDAFIAFGAWVDGENVAAAIAFDHGDDCGIFNMGTLQPARRRGIASALTVHHLREARLRGRRTATLQATPVAERIYSRVGFRDLGRFIEYAPRRPSIVETR